MSLARSIWIYRGFILASVRREFTLRHQRSLLGFSWALINPLAMVLIYLVVFSRIMSDKLTGMDSGFSYGIYLCSGILAWSLFQDIVSRGQTVFLDNANLLKKLSFPRVSLMAIAVLTALVQFTVGFAVFLAVLCLIGHVPGISLLAAVPVLMILVAFAAGLGVVLGVLNVLIRDVGQAMSSVLQVWFWLTPIVYPANTLPSYAADLLRANPVTPLIEALHGVFMRQAWPDWVTLIYPTAVAVLFCLLGVYGFRRSAADMVDEL